MPSKKVSKEEKAQRERDEAHVELLAAEARYLRAHGWAPFVPTTPDEPILWKDDCILVRKLTQDAAVTTQKMRQVEANRASRKI